MHGERATLDAENAESTEGGRGRGRAPAGLKPRAWSGG